MTPQLRSALASVGRSLAAVPPKEAARTLRVAEQYSRGIFQSHDGLGTSCATPSKVGEGGCAGS
jgi:hypothetical protein